MELKFKILGETWKGKCMKKTFEFVEKVTYTHTVEVELSPEQEDDYELYADILADEIEEDGESYQREDIARKFAKRYGDDKVTFCVDGSPSIEFETY